MALSQNERIARLQLIRSETVGAITFYKLLARYGSAVKALDALPLLAQRGGKKQSPHIMTNDEATKELSRIHAYGADLIIFGDDNYPEWLTTIEDAPPVISFMGNPAILSQSCIGIVGARNASANAKRFTHHLAAELGQKGHIIISGMARGIDTAAHTASLKTGTIAVLAGGIDEIYPTENSALYHDIAQNGGCVISEMPIGTKPTAHHFPRRNRIVSGLAKGVVVVEASVRSGSLITARLASEQGREVFAVPGFPGDPRAAGPNSLIQNGAKLIQNADDILVELMTMNAKSIQPQSSLFRGVSEPCHDGEGDFISVETPENIHEIIMQALSSTPLDVDELTRASGLKITAIQTTLLELELAGIIHRHPGNRVSRVT